MTASTHERAEPGGLPTAFFVGDFNTGKSALINALLHREAVPTSREESRALPTFLGRSARKEAYFAALTGDGAVEAKTQEEFFAIRQPLEGETPYRALAAHYPTPPFRALQLADTGGISGEAHHDARALAVDSPERALLVVVTDIEYWASKHNMALISRNVPAFGANLVVVANKADHLNAADIRKVADKAAKRMEQCGIDPVPRFFAVSARLEAARRDPFNEYRARTKREVRELCDAGFDALRVALYEFEAAHGAGETTPDLEQVLCAPQAASFIATQEGMDA
jgi:hypothetical protein